MGGVLSLFRQTHLEMVSRSKNKLIVSIKCIPFKNEMSINERRDNGVNEAGTSRESLSPSRCLVDRKCGPGRDQATVRRKRSTQENICLMKCYSESHPEMRRYRKRLPSIWEEKKCLK